jgi:carbon storage regulator
MLVLSRKTGEQIVLPDCRVTIQVLEIGKRKVRLGITAPGGTAVHRVEVWQRMCRQNEDGAETEEETNGLAAACEPGRGIRAAAAGGGDLDNALADWIARKMGGALASLSVEMAGDGLVRSGSTG